MNSLFARSTFSRRLLAAWLGGSALLGGAGAAWAQDELKVAVVDVNRVFMDYYKVDEFNGKIDEARRTYAGEVDVRMQEHHRLVEELARIDKDLEKSSFAGAARADREKQRGENLAKTEKVEADLREFRLSRERAIEEMTQRARTQVVEDMLVVLNARVASQHYTLILNKSGQVAGGKVAVLYANDSLDITNDVVTALNRNRPPPGHPQLPGARRGG